MMWGTPQQVIGKAMEFWGIALPKVICVGQDVFA